MASTIRTMVLNVATLSVPVALKTATERKLPTFSTASPEGHKYERFIGNGEEELLVETEEDAKAISEELGTKVEPSKPRYKDLVTGSIFEEDEIAKGVWEGDDTFYPIDKDEIDKIEELTKLSDLTIQSFIPMADVPWERTKNTYYLTPNKGAGLKALNLLREGMEQTQTAGVALLCPKSRVSLAVIYPKHGGMMIAALSFAEEWAQVREGAAALSDPRGAPTEEELALAVTLIERLTAEDATFIDGIEDVQANMKVELIERAKMGEPLTEAQEAREVETDGRGETPLERALKESVAAITKAKKKAKPKSRKASPRTTSGKKAAATR